MVLFKTSLVPYTTMVAGVIITGVGLYFWQTLDSSTKLFQLSNELVGAGFFIIAVGVIGRVLVK